MNKKYGWKYFQDLKAKKEEHELKLTGYPDFEKNSELADITKYGY